MTTENVVPGDGTVRAVRLYAATVAFAGRPRHALVGSARTPPLLGTALLEGFSLRIDFWGGGRGEIREPPG